METFPALFKFGNGSLIFKSDDNMNKGNFHPACILSIPSKLYESFFLNDQLLGYLREIYDELISAYRRQ